MDKARQQARHFVELEREFHLGALPTEQPHPKTRGLAEATRRETQAGIRMLQSVDDDVAVAARRTLASQEFEQLVQAMEAALAQRKRICFSGCGATGRLSILLEAAYRGFWREACPLLGSAAAENAVSSIMTGGEYALVRSVESFEDYESFGRQQVVEAGIGPGDVLLAITEGGETSSVIGTAWQALEAGASVFFACNNPLDVLSEHVERSRRIIADDRVVKLDLSSGPMAVTGSTRMQATTAELLVIGAALEMALASRLKPTLPARAFKELGLGAVAEDFSTRFQGILNDLAQPSAVETLARWAEVEESLYRSGNAMTYFANDYLLDIFTDTTERAPTFSLPPFRKHDDPLSPRPLAFVKNPLRPTAQAWHSMVGREPRCLAWDAGTYRELGAEERIWRNPPALDREELFKFLIGNEDDPSRYSANGDCAALVVAGAEAAASGPGSRLGEAVAVAAEAFPTRVAVAVGPVPPPEMGETIFHVPCRLPVSPLRLWDRLALKLALNTVSTATAARMGRLAGNWMAHVETTNKKLIDRGTRLVAELASLDYADACVELHITREQMENAPAAAGDRMSPVAATLERLRKLKTPTKGRGRSR